MSSADALDPTHAQKAPPPGPAPGYRPSPRPTFDRPTLISRRDVQRHIWGDRETGYVADWIYASGDKLHTIMFGLAAGRGFTHSPSFRTIFGADETLFVVEGTMVLTNPQTGEVVTIQAGEAAVFGPGTWHHAFAHNATPLRVLEFFAPPPSTGTSGPYAAAQPYLEDPTGVRDQLLGQLDAASHEPSSLRAVRKADLSWRYECGLMVGLISSTAELTTALVEIDPGVQAAPMAHGGDALIVGLEGEFHLRVEDSTGIYGFELGHLDAAFIPQGARYEILSFGDRSSALLGVAPRYLP